MRSAVMLAAVWVAGCRPLVVRAPGASLADSLTLTQDVRVSAESVELVLHVTNPTRKPIRLEYSSEQRFDFAVRDAAGAEVWRWSGDRMFAQVAETETLGAGASVKYEAVWRPGRRSGRFTVLGRLVALPRAREQQTEIELQGRSVN